MNPNNTVSQFKSPRNSILLVEDNEDDVALMQRAIATQSVANTVMVAANGMEALRILLNNLSGEEKDDGLNLPTPDNWPALVILDLQLPGLSGFEVLRRARRWIPMTAVPIIALTSSRDNRDLTLAYGYQANSYVCKPVDFDVFLEVISQIVRYWLIVSSHLHT